MGKIEKLDSPYNDNNNIEWPSFVSFNKYAHQLVGFTLDLLKAFQYHIITVYTWVPDCDPIDWSGL